MDKCVRYLRVSTLKQDESNQIRAIDEFIKEKGWKCIRTYRDHGVSAYKDVKRKDFERMLRDAEKREFQHIVVFDLDRFSRRPEAEVLALIKNLRLVYDVEINSVNGDSWRDIIELINKIPDMGFIGQAISDFLQVLFVGMAARQARLESELKSMRILESAKFQKARDERRIGKQNIPDDVVKLVEALLEHGVPYKGIVQQVEYKNDEGVIKTPSEPSVSIIKKHYFNRKLKQNSTVRN